MPCTHRPDVSPETIRAACGTFITLKQPFFRQERRIAALYQGECIAGPADERLNIFMRENFEPGQNSSLFLFTLKKDRPLQCSAQERADSLDKIDSKRSLGGDLHGLECDRRGFKVSRGN